MGQIVFLFVGAQNKASANDTYIKQGQKSYRYDTSETYGWTGGVREKVGYKNDPSAKVKKLKIKHRLSNASYTIITL